MNIIGRTEVMSQAGCPLYLLASDLADDSEVVGNTPAAKAHDMKNGMQGYFALTHSLFGVISEKHDVRNETGHKKHLR